MRISVIIPTNRHGGLEHAKASLLRQTFSDFEILVGSPFESGLGRWVHDDFKGGFWALNRIYNRLFAEARGELLVTLQDFIWVPPDGLERFWTTYERTGGLVTGIGDQYHYVGFDGTHGRPCWSDPKKEWTGFEHPRAYFEGGPVRSDDSGIRRTLLARSHEWNWAAMPKAAILKVNGMDEELDFIGFNFDNVSTAERMYEVGCHFYIDFKNEAFCQTHEQVRHLSKNGCSQRKYTLRKNELKKMGSWPILTTDAKLPSLYHPKDSQ